MIILSALFASHRQCAPTVHQDLCQGTLSSSLSLSQKISAVTLDSSLLELRESVTAGPEATANRLIPAKFFPTAKSAEEAHQRLCCRWSYTRSFSCHFVSDSIAALGWSRPQSMNARAFTESTSPPSVTTLTATSSSEAAFLTQYRA